MIIRNRLTTLAAVAVLATAGCSTWDHLSSRERGAVIGAGVGGVAGAAVTDSAVGTLGGAAVGGLVGHEIGRHNEDDRRDYRHRW